MAVLVARSNGWTAETEVAGITPTGERWKADVLAQRGSYKVAIEVQWSGQTDHETLERQEKYAQSGVRGLWLLRQPGFPVTRDLPAVCIGGSLEQGFSALIPYHTHMNSRDREHPNRWHQSVPMKDLLDAAFSKRLRFGPSGEVTVSVRGGLVECWHPSCRAQSRILTNINIVFNGEEYYLPLSVLGEHPEVLQQLLDQLPISLGVGKIKIRFSKSQERSYLSNGCVRCDRLFGEAYGSEVWDKQEEIYSFRVQLTDPWRNAMQRSLEWLIGDEPDRLKKAVGHLPGWWIMPTLLGDEAQRSTC
jgi:competence protein CoiA